MDLWIDFCTVCHPATADGLKALFTEDCQAHPTGAVADKTGEDVGMAAEDNDEDEGEILSDEEMEVGDGQLKKGCKQSMR